MDNIFAEIVIEGEKPTGSTIYKDHNGNEYLWNHYASSEKIPPRKEK